MWPDAATNTRGKDGGAPTMLCRVCVCVHECVVHININTCILQVRVCCASPCAMSTIDRKKSHRILKTPSKKASLAALSRRH